MIDNLRFTPTVRRQVDPSVKLSLILITYQRVNQLLSMLYALKSQTHQNLEVLVVHDGPTDWKEVRESFPEDPRFQFFATPEHEGFWGYAAEERFEAQTTGDFIGRVNDDEYVAPVYAEWLLHAAITNNVDASYCDFIHNYFQWNSFDAEFKRCRVGGTGWIARRDVRLKTPTPVPYHQQSDGERVDLMVERGCTSVRVPAKLIVLN